MARILNKQIETKIQVLDSEGDPATGATVNYVVRDEADSVFDTGTMSHIANGIFTASWTPDAVGEWTVECYSSNPKFRKSFVYNVEPIANPCSKFKKEDYENTSVSADTYYTVFEGYDVEPLHLDVRQLNDESAMKSLQLRITIDDVVITGGNGTAPSASDHYVCMMLPFMFDYGFDMPGPYGLQMSLTDAYPFGFLGVIDSGNGAYQMIIPVKPHYFKIEAKVVTIGTNQKIQAILLYNQKDTP